MKLKEGILIGIICLLCAICTISNAAGVSVTKENLQEAYNNKVLGEGSTATVEDSVITLQTEGKNYRINYSLAEKPIFYTEVEVNSSMKDEEVTEALKALKMPMVGYIAVGNIQGCNDKDLLSQFMTKAYEYAKFENLNEEKDNVINNLKKTYSGKFKVSDKNKTNTFEWIIEVASTTNEAITLKSTITTNIDGDYTDLNSFNFTVENSLKTQETVVEQETVKKENVVNNTVNNDKTQANINKIPNAGLEENMMVNFLKGMIIIAVIAIVGMLISSKKYRRE